MKSDEQSYHTRITAAGWAYRGDRRHWLIYKNPTTGLWHTRAEAIGILGAHSNLSMASADQESTHHASKLVPE